MSGTSNTRQGETSGISFGGALEDLFGWLDIEVRGEIPLPGGKTGANPGKEQPANAPPTPGGVAGLSLGTLLAIGAAILAFKK